MEVKNANKFCETMRTVLNTLLDIARGKNENQGSKYLMSYFDKDKDLFCRFVGFARMEMRTSEYKKRRVVVDIWAEIAMAGIALGRNEGYADAKRIYKAGV